MLPRRGRDVALGPGRRAGPARADPHSSAHRRGLPPPTTRTETPYESPSIGIAYGALSRADCFWLKSVPPPVVRLLDHVAGLRRPKIPSDAERVTRPARLVTTSCLSPSAARDVFPWRPMAITTPAADRIVRTSLDASRGRLSRTCARSLRLPELGARLERVRAVDLRPSGTYLRDPFDWPLISSTRPVSHAAATGELCEVMICSDPVACRTSPLT